MIELTDLEKAKFLSWLRQETSSRKEIWENVVVGLSAKGIDQENLRNLTFHYAAFSHVTHIVEDLNTNNRISYLRKQNG